MKKDLVASWEFIGQKPSGELREIAVRIGLPTLNDQDSMCLVTVEGLEERIFPIAGVNTLHALILAIRFAESILETYCQQGGQLYDPTEYREEGDKASPFPGNPLSLTP